jgi:hypothetical protein
LGRAFLLCPDSLDVNLLCYGKGIIDLDAEVPDSAFDLSVAEQELHRSQVASAPVDQGRLGSPQGMGTEEVRVQTDAGNPLGNKPGVLPRRHALSRTTSSGEKRFTGLLVGSPQIVIDRLPSLLGQLKLDGLPGLFLSHGRPIDCIPARCNVLDLESNDISAAQLAVDGQIEHRQVTSSSRNLELGAN